MCAPNSRHSTVSYIWERIFSVFTPISLKVGAQCPAHSDQKYFGYKTYLLNEPSEHGLRAGEEYVTLLLLNTHVSSSVWRSRLPAHVPVPPDRLLRIFLLQQLSSRSTFFCELVLGLVSKVKETYSAVFLSESLFPFHPRTDQLPAFQFQWAALVQGSCAPSLHLSHQCWDYCETPALYDFFFTMVHMQTQVHMWFRMIFIWQGNRISNAEMIWCFSNLQTLWLGGLTLCRNKNCRHYKPLWNCPIIFHQEYWVCPMHGPKWFLPCKDNVYFKSKLKRLSNMPGILLEARIQRKMSQSLPSQSFYSSNENRLEGICSM